MTYRPLSRFHQAAWIWFGLFLALLVCWLLDLVVGPVSIPLEEVAGLLIGKPAAHRAWQTILWDFRIPKSITALLAGGALAVAGLQMQTLFRNPLADPYILGISSGPPRAARVSLLAGVEGVTSLPGRKRGRRRLIWRPPRGVRG